MKKVKFVPILASICLAVPSTSMVAYADNLDKDTIVSEIWSEWWVGQGDDGRTFPEASYKHHILEEWVDTNYGSDDYEWSDTGELQYSFKRYYKNMIEKWDFNDDDNGNWTIDTDTFVIIDNRQGGKVYHDYSNDYYAKNYIRWCVENCPQRLQEWCDKGYIYGHIMEKVDECVAEQNKIWKHLIDTDEEYLKAIENADTTKVWQLENTFELEAKQTVLDTVAYR